MSTMQFDLVADTTKLCRVCMTANDGYHTGLHDVTSLETGQPSLHGMLKAICAPVFDQFEAVHLPGMPTKVCAICRNAILAAFKLHQTCIETDHRLVKLLTVKRELLDLEDEDRTGDPLRDEMANISVDQAEAQSATCDIKTDGETRVLKEEQPTEEMEESLTDGDGELEDRIKVEELDLMDASDYDNASESDSGEDDDEPAIEEDTSKATCEICSRTFGKAASLKIHMTLKHKHLKPPQEKGPRKWRKKYACDFCEEIFKNALQFKRHQAANHQNVIDPNQPFACPLCEESFATALELSTHKETHENPVECSCGRRFKSDRRLQIHTASGTCSGENGRRCTICNKIFKTVDIMITHRNSVHTDPVVCPECGQTMANPSSLRIHLRTGYCTVQKDQVPTKAVLAARTCKICGEVQRSYYAVKVHVKVAHPDRMLRCNLCSNLFQTQKFLNVHKRSHGTKTYRCHICSETLPTKEDLIKHRRIHNTPMKCNVCDKMFISKRTLGVHMERHMGLKPFACNICPMRFVTKAEINHHMSTHTKERDHVCDLCGTGFTKKGSLKRHVMRIHEGLRPHPCSLCSLKFAHANQLLIHMYTHTGEKPHKCELCPQAYAQTGDLVKHVARAHGDGNPYLCDLCDESFRLLTDLRQHYRVHVQSTEGGAEQMDEVRFTSVAILKRAFAKAKQRLEIDSGSNG